MTGSAAIVLDENPTGHPAVGTLAGRPNFSPATNAGHPPPSSNLAQAREIRNPSQDPTGVQPVKPTISSTTAKPNKTNHKSRKKVQPALPIIILRKRTMEEAVRSANSMAEITQKIDTATKDSPQAAERLDAPKRHKKCIKAHLNCHVTTDQSQPHQRFRSNT